ncbi:MAG TPA: hypothetical protein ENG40_04220, partial [Thermoprotei archaeon]|nr:hypothetical protein [Thermoprotei archaeon]
MNVFIIMLDSLRPDHLGCYGNNWIKTPCIDSFSRESIIFEKAYSEGLPTLPVRTALFTGRYTLMRRGWKRLELDDIVLAEVLWDAGYHTALITDTYHMHKPGMGYGRGFDYVCFIRGQESDPYILEEIDIDLSKWSVKNYLTKDDREVFIQYLKNRYYWRGEEDHFIVKVVREAVNWIKKMVEGGIKDRLFLWLDSFDPHEPWDPPEEYYNLYAPENYEGLPIILPSTRGPRGGFIDNFTIDEVRHIRAQYAGEITLVDKWIGLFFEKLKEYDLWDNSLIILLSDHGEPLGEHGIIRKVRPWPYEELSRIVLLIKPPDSSGKGRRIKTFVQTVDIAPTILDFLEIPEKRSRWSIYPCFEGKSLKKIVLGEENYIRDTAISGHYRRSWSIRNDKYSLYLWPYRLGEYTFGLNIIKSLDKQSPELYRIDKKYVPPMPKDWNINDQPEIDNIYVEEKEVADDLELKLREKLMESI